MLDHVQQYVFEDIQWLDGIQWTYSFLNVDEGNSFLKINKLKQSALHYLQQLE